MKGKISLMAVRILIQAEVIADLDLEDRHLAGQFVEDYLLRGEYEMASGPRLRKEADGWYLREEDPEEAEFLRLLFGELEMEIS